MSTRRSCTFHIGLALLAGSLLAYELLLLRLFKIAQGHEFTSIAISLGLLGFGASGTLLVLTRRFAKQRARLIIMLCAPLAGLAMLGAYFLGQVVPFRPEFLVWGGRHVWHLALWTLPLVVPFLIGATGLGVVFLRWPRQTRSLYAASLIGSGLGAAGLYGLLHLMRPESAILLIASLTALAGAMMGRRLKSGWVIGCLGLFITGTVALDRVGMPEVRIADTCDLWQLRQLSDARTVATYHGPDGRVDLIESDHFHHNPGVSVSAPPAELKFSAICLDGNLVGDLLRDYPRPRTNSAIARLGQSICATPWVVLVPPRWQYPQAPNKILWLGHPSGLESTRLLRFEDLGYAFPFLYTHAETNSHIREILRHSHDPSPMGHSASRQTQWDSVPASRRLEYRTNYQFHWISEEPLHAIRAEIGPWDLIADVSWGDSPLSESQIRTTTGYSSMLARLSGRGHALFATPVEHPPRASLRAIALVASASTGANEVDVLSCRSYSQSAVAVFPTGIDQFGSALVQFREYTTLFGLDLIWTPDISSSEVNQFNILDEPIYYETARRIFAGEADEVYREYPFDLRPPTEWWPFFWQPFKPATVWGMMIGMRPEGLETIPEANAVLGLIWQVRLLAATALLLILLPLVSLRGGTGGVSRWWVLLYFAALGMGYLMIEILFIFMARRLLGQPVLAASVVVAVMLVFSGWGSLHSHRWRWLFVPLIAMALGAVGVSEVAIHHLMALSLPLRLGLLLMALAPAAFLMGMPFPRGLVFLGSRSKPLIPWAWGINGFASVLAAPLATVFAITGGYEVVLAVGIACYIVAGALHTKLIHLWGRN